VGLIAKRSVPVPETDPPEGMGADIHRIALPKVQRTEMVEEAPGPHHPLGAVGQRPANLQTAAQLRLARGERLDPTTGRGVTTGFGLLVDKEISHGAPSERCVLVSF